MAIQYFMPHSVASDLVSYEEASALFAEADYPASVTTLKRWVREEGLRTEREGRATLVSFSDLLMVHAKRTFQD